MSKVVKVDVKMARGLKDHAEVAQTISGIAQTLFPDATVQMKQHGRAQSNPRYLKIHDAGQGAVALLKEAFAQNGLKTEYTSQQAPAFGKPFTTPTIYAR